MRRLGDAVRVLGPVSEMRCSRRCTPGADLFAFPSRHEGFGIPVLEAMAQGTAVVCSDIPALREVGGDAARFVAARRRRGARRRDRLAPARRAARDALVARGLAHAQGYSWERCADATIAVYHEALPVRNHDRNRRRLDQRIAGLSDASSLLGRVSG